MASHIHFNRQSVMKKSIILLTLLCSFLCAFSHGLQFHGNERNIDGRSSLAIPSELSKAKTAGVYDLGFTIRNHNISSPGNIFCIQNRCDSSTFALMFNYNEPTDQATFIFAKSGERNLCSTSFKGSELREKAMPVVLKINQAAGTIYSDRLAPRFYSRPGTTENRFCPSAAFQHEPSYGGERVVLNKRPADHFRRQGNSHPPDRKQRGGCA